MKRNYHTQFRARLKLVFVIAAISSLHTAAIAQADPVSAYNTIISPHIINGIIVKPLEKHEVPKMLKDQARQEIQQTQTQGFITVSEDAVGYLDRAVAAATVTGEGELKSLEQLKNSLAIRPASVRGTALEVAHLLGAIPSGVYMRDGWTGIARIFIVPELGPVVFEEFDYVSGGGGLVMIKEAINEEINGRPAIIRVKKSNSGKSVAELTWSSERKIYTLRANHAVNGRKVDELVRLAKSITD